jgi:hypothetical protein
LDRRVDLNFGLSRDRNSTGKSMEPTAWVAPALTSGLGNRLFQVAAAAGAAERWNRPLVFYMPAVTESPHGRLGTVFDLFPTVPILERGPAEEPFTLQEPPRRFYEYLGIGSAPPHPTRPVLFRGFWQSPRYFPAVSMPAPDWDRALGGPAVRRWLERDAGLAEEGARRRCVALHVRLGDYRKLAHHQQDLGGYYANALGRVPRATRLHLFSDEPELCAATFGSFCRQAGLEFTVARVRSDVESLYELSLCWGGTICANSTFSWWGAWFAHAACPEHWATMPDKWGAGQPEPVDLFPQWAQVLPTGG